MANVVVTIVVVDDQALPVPIDGVLVRIFDAYDTFVTEGVTGVVTPGSGELDILLLGEAIGVGYKVWLSKQGFSFPPANYFEVSVTDPAPAPFEFTGHEGATAPVVKVTLKDPSDDPIEGARIRFYTEADSFITEVLTDAAGEVEIPLEGDPDPGRIYIIRVMAVGFIIENGSTQVIKVQDPLLIGTTNVFDLVGEAPVVPSSSDPNMCLISGTFTNVSLGPLKRLRLRFMPKFTCLDGKVTGVDPHSIPAIVGGMQILNEYVAETDEHGYLEVLLPRGGMFDLDIHGYFKPTVSTFYQLYVPDAASARLEDVLFPYVQSVDYDDYTVDLTVTETQELVLTVTGSNGLVIEPCLFQTFLEFSTPDPLVATVSMNDNGNLVVVGRGVGTTTIQVTRKENTWASRLPDIPNLEVTDPIVTVI